MGLDVPRHAAVGAEGLEQAVAEEEAGVGRVDPHVLRSGQPAVPEGAAHEVSWEPRAMRKARALAALSSYSSSGSESATMPQPA